MNRFNPPSGGLAVFGVYSLLSTLFTWPLITRIGSDVPGDLGDSLLNMWILSWGAQHLPQLLTGQIAWADYWNANIFHPEPLSLALSEHLTGQVLQILPIYWLTGNVILCYNLLFISTFAISAFGTYLLVRDLTGNRHAALIAGLIYGFLPYRIASVPHLQVMSSQWMPLALYGLNRFVSSGSKRALAGGTAALVMQNWSCGYYLLYFAPFVPLFLLHRMWSVGALRAGRVWAGLAAAAAVTLALTLPLLVPYQQAQEQFGFERTLGEVYFFSANVRSYFTASENVHLYGDWLRAFPSNEQELFLGFMPVVLLLIAALATLRASVSTPSPLPAPSRTRAVVTWLLAFAAVVQFAAFMSVMLAGGFEFRLAGISISARTPARLAWQFLIAFALLLAVAPRARAVAARAARTPVFIAMVLTVLAVVMSYGPNYGIYGFLYEHVPGFNGVRVPARYAMIAGLFLAILTGVGAAPLLVKCRTLLPSAFCLLLLSTLILAEGFAAPIEINRTWGGAEALPPARVYPADGSIPPVYARIRELPRGSAISEFPFGDPAWEIRYTYYAAAHWKPITNGYSGSFPARYKERVARLQRIDKDPDGAWTSLKQTGSTHVVVHRNAYAYPPDADTVEGWLTARGATVVERFPDGDILLKL